MGDWTGTVPTFPVGNLRAADMTTMADIATAIVTAETTWVPTLTNLTLGSGTVVAKYRRVGKWVDYRFIFTLGSGSAVGTGPTFTLPATPHADYVVAANAGVPIGAVDMYDANIPAIWVGLAFCVSGSTASPVYSTEVGAGSSTAITATAPFTWTTSDKLIVYGTFETA